MTLFVAACSVYYSANISALKLYQKHRERYENFCLKRRLAEIESQLQEMVEQELCDSVESREHAPDSIDTQRLVTSPPDVPSTPKAFQRADERVKELEAKKQRLKRTPDAFSVSPTSSNYFDKQTLNFVNTYGDSGGYCQIRKALGLKRKSQQNLWGV